jgi:molecular chaperone IbpA
MYTTIHTPVVPDFKSHLDTFNNIQSLIDSTFIADSGYPKYNIYKLDDEPNSTYIEMAVTGFKNSELKVYIDSDGYLAIEGNKENYLEKDYRKKFLSTKDFKKKFTIDSHAVVNNVFTENGLLTIEIVMEKPEIETFKIESK